MVNQTTLALLLVTLCGTSVAADGFRGDPRARACGEDAFTFAEVTENRPKPPRGTPIVSIPDTLCADLADDGRFGIPDIQVVIDPQARPRQDRRPR